MTYPNVMVDIETLDTDPTNRAVIASIGLVSFDIREEDDWNSLSNSTRFLHIHLPMQMQIEAGRTVSARVLQWWMKQDSKAQAEILHFDEEHDLFAHGPDIFAGAIERMQTFLAPLESDTEMVNGIPRVTPVALWAKPAHFDCPKLETLFTDFGYIFPVPWWCYRDMTSYKVAAKLVGIRDPKLPPNPNMIKHDALCDAKEQVLELQGWYQSLKSLRGAGT